MVLENLRTLSRSALMSDAVAHTLDGCEVQPLGEELNPEKEELLVDMEALKEKGLDIINTTAYIAITGDFLKYIQFLYQFFPTHLNTHNRSLQTTPLTFLFLEFFHFVCRGGVHFSVWGHSALCSLPISKRLRPLREEIQAVLFRNEWAVHK